MKKLLDSKLHPQNVANLINPKINQHIWGKLKESTRKSDMKLAKIGERSAKFLIVSTAIVDKVSDEKVKELSEVNRMGNRLQEYKYGQG